MSYGQYTVVSFKGKQQTSSIQEKVLLRIYGSTEHGIFRREDEVKLDDPYDLIWFLLVNTFLSLCSCWESWWGGLNSKIVMRFNDLYRWKTPFFSVLRQVQRARFVAGCGFGPQALAENSTERRGSTLMARCWWILMKVVLKNGSKGELQLTRKKITTHELNDVQQIDARSQLEISLDTNRNRIEII